MDILVITYLLNGLLMIAMPLALGIWLSRRFRLGWRLWWIGAATFVISQVGHIPFNWVIDRLFDLGTLPAPPPEWRAIFNATFLGLSAGLFEELTRAGVYRWWADDARTWRKGVQLGAGHGGIEAIILGVLVLISYANMLILRGPEAARLVPPEQMALVQQQVAAYWSAYWPATLLGAVERLFTLIVQISFSVIVLQAFIRRQWGWVALAVLWHAAIDGVVVYLAGLWRATTWGMYAVEGIIALFALISLGIIFALRGKTPDAEEQPPQIPDLPAPAIQPVEVPETEENLENSRYAG